MAPDTASAAQASMDAAEVPDLHGKSILLVLSGGATRKCLLNDILRTGVHVVCYSDSVTPWAAGIIHDWILGPTNETKAAIETTDRFLKDHPSLRFSGLLCYDEYGLLLATCLADHLGLPFLPSSMVENVRDKYKFRQLCVANGIAAPAFMRVVGPFEESARRQFESLGMSMPVVVKPAMGAGSNYVKKVESFDELAGFIERFHEEGWEKARRWVRDDLDWRAMLIEEYVAGAEVDVDCVVEKGKVVFACISDNRAPEEPYFLERGGRCPSTLPQQHQEELRQQLDRLLEMHGSSVSGCFHFEAKYSPTMGAVPIEFNLRIGNAETYTMVMGAYGVNLAYEALRACVGLPSAARKATGVISHCSSINFLPAWRGLARLDKTKVDPSLDKRKEFVGIHFYHPEGSIVELPPAGYQSLGWMVVRGSTAQDAEERLDDLASLVTFQLSDPRDAGGQ